MYIEDYKLVTYVEYFAKFGELEVPEEIRIRLSGILSTDKEKDLVIRSILNICKTRYKAGSSLSNIMQSLEYEFDYLNLNSRVDYSQAEFFFEGFITSSFSSKLNTGVLDTNLFNFRDMIARFMAMDDSYYKVNIGLAILRYSLRAYNMGEVPIELLQVSDYMNSYDLTDEQIQQELGNTFAINISD